MDWLVYPLRDFLVWLFENTLEIAGNNPNNIFLLVLLFGATYWMVLQNKLNKKADADPNQLK